AANATALRATEAAGVLAAALAAGLPVKLHADQLSNLHGAKLAAEHGALSADHLEYPDDDGVFEMVGRERAMLGGEFGAVQVAELVGMQLDRQARRQRGRQHPRGLSRPQRRRVGR